MFGWLFGKKRSAPSRAVKLGRHRSYSEAMLETVGDIYAEYDAAQTTTDNSRHWANADNLSASAANSKEVRDALRSRARYEAQENNSYAKGICLTLANDTIGTGPRLQMLLKDRAANQQIESAFASWCRAVNLAAKLRTMRLSKVVDGEAFAQFITNRRLRGVQLDLALVESEQVSTPFFKASGAQVVDGIEFDSYGNPRVYHLLKSHPGDELALYVLEKDNVPSSEMLHMFRCDRPGQKRGVPEITPALPLFAQLRRFTLATIFAAETAANFSGVMYTDAPAIAEPDDVDAMDAIELERNAMLTLPRGWKMGQMKAEHPSTTYGMFRDAILNEIARCLNMPFNVAAGNSSGYNFASTRADHQTYGMAISVERSEWESCCLDPILYKWFDEAVFIDGLLPEGLGSLAELPHRWHWDGRPHVDPQKNASAQEKRLASGTTSYPQEFAEQGLDWEVEMTAQATALGLTLEEYQAKLVEKLFGGAQQVEQTEEMDEQETEAA